MFQALKKAENKVIEANKNQLLKGENQLGDIVGVYSPYTEIYADRDGILTDKTPGSPYNFNWSGDFYDGFNLSISGDEATISSVGVGSGDKKEFLTTSNLFGLNDENLKEIIQSEIIPFINQFARNTIGI